MGRPTLGDDDTVGEGWAVGEASSQRELSKYRCSGGRLDSGRTAAIQSVVVLQDRVAR